MTKPFATGDPEDETLDVPARSDLEKAAFVAPAISLGSVIGARYRLVELLGAGGMGHVYVAENMAIGLRVAVKVLKPELLADPVFQTRFQREAHAIASIAHPNVVRFLDLVLGEPTFLVMELVRGPTLAERLKKEGALTPLLAVTIAQRLARALTTVHAAGIIHRDLKPSNIVLSPDRELGVSPKIIDFGVVRFAAVSEGMQVTRAGQMLGTLHYMAPEQVSSSDVDARADLYALGSVLFHMLAGKPMFHDAWDEGQLLYNVVHRAAPPLPNGAALPKSLVALVESLVAKRPADRPQDAEAVALQLDRIHQELEPSGPVPALEPVARRSSPLLMGAVALALAAGGFTVGRRTSGTHPGSAGSGMLAIDSSPRGASVILDGKTLAEATPTAVRGLAAGTHTLRVTAPNHTPIEQSIPLGEGAREAVEVTLPPASHFVEIQTMPRDATVFLNEQLVVQRTPVRLQIADDEFYQIRIEKLGYQTLVARITPGQRDPALKLTLEPETEPRGVLVVDSNSTGRVFVDGGDSGYKTPTLGMLLPAGAHTVQLRTENAKSNLEKVQLEAGATVRVLLDLQPAKTR